MDSILSARKLSRFFSTDETVIQAVKDIDLEIGRGDFTVIMGASGSGKSTLLYVLSGLDKPSSGEIDFRGRRLDKLNETELAVLRRKSFGFVFQSINLVPNLTIEENVLVAGYLLKKPRSAVIQRAKDLMAELDIASVAQHLPSESSGGEQQRGAMARALINEPDLLFADEPTGALNYSSGQMLLDHLNAINAQGQSICMVTHDLKAAARGNRVILMRDGGIVGDFRFQDGQKDIRAQLAAREKALFAWLSDRGW
jgi:putative ABC transport system ATP-binding protein